MSWQFLPPSADQPNCSLSQTESQSPRSFDKSRTIYTKSPSKAPSSLLPSHLSAPSLTDLLVDRLALSILADEDKVAKVAAAKGLEDKNTLRAKIMARIISTFQDGGDDNFAKRFVEGKILGMADKEVETEDQQPSKLGGEFDAKIKKTQAIIQTQANKFGLSDGSAAAATTTNTTNSQKLSKNPGQLTSSSSTLPPADNASSSADAALNADRPASPSAFPPDGALNLDRPPSPIVFARTLTRLRIVPEDDPTLPPQLLALQRDENRERLMWEAALEREKRKLDIRRKSVGQGVSFERRASATQELGAQTINEPKKGRENDERASPAAKRAAGQSPSKTREMLISAIVDDLAESFFSTQTNHLAQYDDKRGGSIGGKFSSGGRDSARRSNGKHRDGGSESPEDERGVGFSAGDYTLPSTTVVEGIGFADVDKRKRFVSAVGMSHDDIEQLHRQRAARYGAWYIPPEKWSVGMLDVLNEMAAKQQGSWGEEMAGIKSKSKELQERMPELFISKSFKRTLTLKGERVPHFLRGVPFVRNEREFKEEGLGQEGGKKEKGKLGTNNGNDSGNTGSGNPPATPRAAHEAGKGTIGTAE